MNKNTTNLNATSNPTHPLLIYFIFFKLKQNYIQAKTVHEMVKYFLLIRFAMH